MFIENIKNYENYISQHNNSKENFNDKIKELETLVDHYAKENMKLQEKIQITENNSHNIKIELENRNSELEYVIKENKDLKQFYEEEKIKSKNLVNLIKDLEKKKSNSKIENECNELKQQIEYLNNIKLREMEMKYKSKLEKKDLIIKKLDESLVEYEEQLQSTKK
jgi:hypothetical protein